MEKTEVIKMIGAIKGNYPDFMRDMSQQDVNVMVNTWHDIFKNYESVIVWNALKLCFLYCKYPPKIADVVEQIKGIEKVNEPSDMELWNILAKAIKETQVLIYFGMKPVMIDGVSVEPYQKLKEIFNDLPKTVQEYLGSWNSLVSLANSENIEIERAMFFKRIEGIRKKVDFKQECKTRIELPMQQKAIQGTEEQ